MSLVDFRAFRRAHRGDNAEQLFLRSSVYSKWGARGNASDRVRPEAAIAELCQTLGSHLCGPEFERSSSAAASSLKALYVFNVRLTTDGEACCLDPSHAELDSI